jgi:hypothetical protein
LQRAIIQPSRAWNAEITWSAIRGCCFGKVKDNADRTH